MKSSFGIGLAERGVLPDAIVRLAIRSLCRRRLQRHLIDYEERKKKFLVEASQGPVAPVPEKANQQHYELPPEFFSLCLGSRRKYSCCYWPDSIQSLDEAENASLELTVERAGIENGMKILELGCGWGALTIWMAVRFPDSQITAVSNSDAQRRFINAELEQRGFGSRVTVVTADMNDFATTESFDRVVSVEMFEHMRNHKELLRRIAGWMTSDGALFVHVFCHREVAYPFEIDGENDWMARNFFTGGMMPSHDWLSLHDEHLVEANRWWLSGIHYQRTCDAWLENMTANRIEVMALMSDTYGKQAALWYHRWRMFYMACAELFGLDQGSQWGVSHALFQRTGLSGAASP